MAKSVHKGTTQSRDRGARYAGLTLRIPAREYPAIGPGKAQLLSLIAVTGSISEAARQMGMSYRRAWQLVDQMNTSFREPIVATAIGGRNGGGAAVTDFGRETLVLYREMESKAASAIARDLARFSRRLRQARVTK